MAFRKEIKVRFLPVLPAFFPSDAYLVCRPLQPQRDEKHTMQDRTAAHAAPGKRAFDENRLARHCDISHRTLQQWRRMGIGPVYLKLGNRVSYRREDVEQYERQALRRSASARAFAWSDAAIRR